LNEIKLTGTVVMQVGLKMDASPLLPFIIFVLESMRVVGVEYPIGTPVIKQTLSASNSKTWARGRNPMRTSSGLISTTSMNPFIVAMQLLCERRTPFGVPVDPDVYIIIAVSSFLGGTQARNFIKKNHEVSLDLRIF
jgi:hypothetical protein